MKLSKPTQTNLIEMMGWFNSPKALFDWAGPNFRYPFTLESFTEDLKLDSLASFSLLSSELGLVAFGQCYLREGKCHLGRLAVSPQHRGKGVVTNLIDLISAKGMRELNVNSLSLFVLTDNTSAISAYRRYGFTVSEYPEKMPLEGCYYMVKSDY